MRLLISIFAFTLVLPTTFCDDSDNQDYILDVVAVVDSSMVEFWKKYVGSNKNVLAEVKSLFYEVNMLYQSLQKYNLSIEVRLKDVIFPSEPIVPISEVTNGTVLQATVGTAFKHWMIAHSKYTYDHAMLITNYEMKGKNGVNKVTGMAPTSTACWTSARSRIQGRLDFSTAITAAHEIGHTLGAEHDSDENKCMNGYVMSPSQWSGSRNRFYFSPCSAAYFRSYIGRLAKKKKTCLLESTSPPIKSKRMGELFDGNQMCERKGKWLVSKHATGDAVCKVIKCRDPKWTDTVSPPEGMSCGNGKHCSLGYCV